MTRVVPRKHGERGGIVGLMPAILVLAALMLAGLGRLGSGVVAQSRADSAADAAALAAADQLALGASPSDARSAASDTAHRDGARLVSCDCRDTVADVVVVVRPPIPLGTIARLVYGRARAEVSPDR